MCWFSLRRLPGNLHRHHHHQHVDTTDEILTAKVVEIKPERARKVRIAIPGSSSSEDLLIKEETEIYTPLRGDGTKRHVRFHEPLHGRGERRETTHRRYSMGHAWPFIPDLIPVAPGRDSAYPAHVFPDHRHHHHHPHILRHPHHHHHGLFHHHHDHHHRSSTWGPNHRSFAVRAATNSALEELRKEATGPSLRRYGRVEVKTSDIPWNWDCADGGGDGGPRLVTRAPRWVSNEK